MQFRSFLTLYSKESSSIPSKREVGKWRRCTTRWEWLGGTTRPETYLASEVPQRGTKTVPWCSEESCSELPPYLRHLLSRDRLHECWTEYFRRFAWWLIPEVKRWRDIGELKRGCRLLIGHPWCELAGSCRRLETNRHWERYPQWSVSSPNVGNQPELSDWLISPASSFPLSKLF